MSKYYSNKSDFSEAGSNLQSGGGGSTSSTNAYSNYVSGGYPSGGSSKSMSQLINDIEEVANTVTSEGVADLYVQTGEAALNVTKNSDEFDKATTRVSKILKSAQKIHQNIMQNIDSKFTLGIDKVLEGLNKINGSESKYKTKNLTRTEHNYRPVNGNICAPTAYYDDKKEVSYSLSEILDGKASPIKAAKDVYSKRLEAVKESLKHKDKMTDEQLKQIKGKSAEEVLELMYPKDIPDYQKLKASRYYEEHRETLQKVDTGIKIFAWIGAIGGVALSPFTGGSSLALTYASTAYLAADSAYSAATGHTMITGDRLSTEERVWAGIDAASVVLSAGAGSYLTKLRKAGKAGSTLLKLASHADDVNDVSKVAYAMATGKDTKAAIGNLVMGQAQGFAAKKAGGLLNGKFGKTNATEVPDIPTNSTKQHIEVDSSGLNSKKLKIDPTVVHQKKTPKLDLKIEPTVKADLASTPKPHVDVETSKIKPVEAVAGAATAVPKSKKPDIDVLTKPKDLSTIKGEAVEHVGTTKPKVELDVPEVKEPTTREIIDSKLQEYGVSWDEFNRLRNTHVTKMTPSEYDMMLDIRNTLPKPDTSTVMQKIMPIDAEGWMFNQEEDATAGGYVAKRSDVKNITNIHEAVEGLRLDYEGSPFVETMIDANGNRVAVRDQNGNLVLKTDAYLRLEYTTDETGYITIPYGDMDGNLLDKDGNIIMDSKGKPEKVIDPASGNGFIKSDSDEFLVPEYRHSDRSRLKQGSKLYLNVGGEEVLVGIVDKDGKMVYVKG
ncbi:hypothetical protein [uncultured Streptococcus sp.]|uniref:hypothetical protein n=1 Tax=uncultured Streptococcus sp. TaxID=83427 RepID=UPI0028DC3BF0|nr:hypothetical protein [uncultured Streptococcus sp.]